MDMEGMFSHLAVRVSGLTENTMTVSFDNKFIRRDQKRRNVEACRPSPMYFWSRLINLI